MGQIQSGVGLVTGIAIEDTVNQLMAINARPRDQLLSRNELLQREQVALTELTTLVVGVQLTTDRLGQPSLFSAAEVSSSSPDLITARNTGSPSPGTYAFVPVRQAQSQQLTSALLASPDQTVGDGELVLHTGGFLDESVSLDSLNGGQGVARGFIRITDRSGTRHTDDLRFAQNVAEVVDAINAADDLRVVAGIDGDRLTLTDLSGAVASNLQVEEVGGGKTAADLGLGGISVSDSTLVGSSIQSLVRTTAVRTLRDGRGLDFPLTGAALQFQLQDGTTLEYQAGLTSNNASLGQLIDEINAVGAGKFEARIASDGRSLEVQDLTAGSGTFAISSPDGDLAAQLGFDKASTGGVIAGDRLLAGLNDVLLSSLAGGRGLEGLGQISITDRSGASDVIDLSSAGTVNEVIDAINRSSVEVRAQLNGSQTGIELIDQTGVAVSDLIVANADATNSATALQLEGAYSQSTADSGSLNRQFVSRNTRLAELNQGKGVRLGTIQITDSQGAVDDLKLADLELETVGEVLDAINALSTNVRATLNETGDGILLIDEAGGSGTLQVEDSGNGSAAVDLGIAGQASELIVARQVVSGIDGSSTIRIETTAETTLSDLTDSINGLSNGPVTANLLDLNSAGGARLLLNSTATGAASRVAVSGDLEISFSQTAAARDALLAFGASESSGGVLVSSSNNTFSGLVEGIELAVTGTSDTPVTVSVSQTGDQIKDQIEQFVDQFNRLRDRLDELTAFDQPTQSVGLLFGDSAALRIDVAFGRLLSGSFRGTGPIASLGQLGIRLNQEGQLDFDQTAFDAAYASDAAAIEQFFTDEDLGFAAKARQVTDSLAAVGKGALLNRTTTLNNQIEQNNERIANMDARLERRRERLLKQFYDMELTIARLQQDLSSLNQLQIIPPISRSQLPQV